MAPGPYPLLDPSRCFPAPLRDEVRSRLQQAGSSIAVQSAEKKNSSSLAAFVTGLGQERLGSRGRSGHAKRETFRGEFSLHHLTASTLQRAAAVTQQPSHRHSHPAVPTPLRHQLHHKHRYGEFTASLYGKVSPRLCHRCAGGGSSIL